MTGRAVAARAVAAAPSAAALAVALACGGPVLPDPVFERVQAIAGDAAAARSIAAMLSAYGGFDAWEEHGNAEYRFSLALYAGDPAPRRITRQLHRLALGREVHLEMEDLDQALPEVVRLDGNAVVLTRAGAPAEPEDTEFRRAYGRAVRWDFRLPWSLLDPGTVVSARGVRTPETPGPVPAGPCDVLRLRTGDASPGGLSDDWHDLYVSRRSHLVEQVHSYRAGPNDYRLAVWSDHRSFDGLRVATRRRTYASDAAASIGRLEAVTEYSDVRFDVGSAAPPGDDGAGGG